MTQVLVRSALNLCCLITLGRRERYKNRVSLARLLISWCLVVWAAGGLLRVEPAWGQAASTPEAAAVELQVFHSEGCPHCAAARVFLDQLQAERPALRIVYRSVDSDPAAAEELQRVSRAAGLWPPGVPTFVVGTRVLVGFDDAAHAGQDLKLLIAGGQARPGLARTPWGTLSAEALGLPLFTLALGLLDGFNPCAMWVLLFLLSLLVRLKDRRRMAWVAGTFVVVSGAVYYAFMTAWLNVFLAVGMSEGVRMGLAGVALLIGAFNLKDGLTHGVGPSLSIPASARPGLVARMHAVVHSQALLASMAGVALLAVIVNGVELLCTAGFPAVYSAVLAQHPLSTLQHHAYLGLYILAYIADDSLMVGAAVMALGSRKLGERAGRGLKLASGAVMLALGTVLLWRPQWLF